MTFVVSWLLSHHDRCHVMVTVMSWYLWCHDYCHVMIAVSSWSLLLHDLCDVITLVTSCSLSRHDRCYVMITITSWWPSHFCFVISGETCPRKDVGWDDVDCHTPRRGWRTPVDTTLCLLLMGCAKVYGACQVVCAIMGSNITVARTPRTQKHRPHPSPR